MSAEAEVIGKALPEGASKNFIWILIALTVVGLVIFIILKVFGNFQAFFDSIGKGITSTLEALHLKDDQETVDNKKAVNDAISGSASVQNAFAPQMWKGAPSGAHLLTAEVGDTLAKQIWGSVGAMWDDPESGLAAIKQCGYQSQVSWLADRFNGLYQRDLLDWLKQKYDTRTQVDVLAQIVKYVSNLPKYS